MIVPSSNSLRNLTKEPALTLRRWLPQQLVARENCSTIEGMMQEMKKLDDQDQEDHEQDNSHVSESRLKDGHGTAQNIKYMQETTNSRCTV